MLNKSIYLILLASIFSQYTFCNQKKPTGITSQDIAYINPPGSIIMKKNSCNPTPSTLKTVEKANSKLWEQFSDTSISSISCGMGIASLIDLAAATITVCAFGTNPTGICIACGLITCACGECVVGWSGLVETNHRTHKKNKKPLLAS